MMSLSCLCGQIRVDVPRRPDFVHECNCAFCRKSGASWGYFDPSEVTVTGPTQAFRREDKDDPSAQLQFCGRCGATTHWVLTESAVARFGNAMLGVNMRLADERDLAGIERRYPDGKGWSGEGEFGFVRASDILGHEGGSAA
jgi:hypothetical protein